MIATFQIECSDAELFFRKEILQEHLMVGGRGSKPSNDVVDVATYCYNKIFSVV